MGPQTAAAPYTQAERNLCQLFWGKRKQKKKAKIVNFWQVVNVHLDEHV